MTETTSKTIKEEQGRRIAADGVLQGKIAALEASMANVVLSITKIQGQITPPVPPPVEPPPVAGVAHFPGIGANTQEAFLALVADMAIDVIEMAAGTYSGWHDLAVNVDRTSRPLLVRPAAGAAVIWDGNAGSGDGLFYPGWSSKCAYITFDPAGTGGSFTIQNFALTQTGLISTAYVDHFAANGFRVVNCTAPTTNGQTAWAVYVATDGTHRGNAQTFNDWTFDTGSDGKVNGLQLYHAPQATGVTALRWKVNQNVSTRCRWGFVGRHDATGVVIDGWQIAHTVYPFDSQGPAGTVSHMTSTDSTNPPIIDSPMTDGGGNSWA